MQDTAGRVGKVAGFAGAAADLAFASSEITDGGYPAQITSAIELDEYRISGLQRSRWR